MRKALMILLGVFLLLGFLSAASAALRSIGTATYGGSSYNLIYEGDQGLVWLDYTHNWSTWDAQTSWAAGLNSPGVLTYNLNPGIAVNWSGDWRLPETVDGPFVYSYDGTTSWGSNITSSEMGHLYYVSLGNLGFYDTSGNRQYDYGLQNTGPFNNLLDNFYWSGTYCSLYPGYAWVFYFGDGGQNRDFDDTGNFGLAVRSAEVSAVLVKNELVVNFGPAYGLHYYNQAGGWKQWNTINPSQMVTVDLNGDGTDELVAAFPGYGLYTKDSANDWQPINNVDPEKIIAADIDGDGKDELVAGFTGYGLYYYDDAGGWSPPINDIIPDAMVRYSEGVACDFGAAYGFWSYNTSAGWSRLNPEDPDKIVAADIDGDGKDELVVSFVGWGLYIYEPEDKTWDSINTGLSDKIVAADIDGDAKDELVVSFVGYGLYTYEPEGRIWDPINTVIPEGMIRQGNGIAADYGGTYGLWVWSLGADWQQRNTVDPGQMTALDIDKDGVEELVVSFPGYGLYCLDETDGWQLLNAVVPEGMKPINFYPSANYVLCSTDDQCGKDQTCDKRECLSCCPNSSIPCIDPCWGKCTEPTSNDKCKADADCRYGAEWCEDGACVACDNSGAYCDLYCKNGMIDPRNGCQPCICKPDYVPCLSDGACADGQVCDRSECLSCCPGSTGPCILACCGKCVDELGDFCGWSSNGSCASDADCMTGGCSGQVCQSISEEPVITTCEWTECYSAEAYGVTCGCVNGTCRWK